MTKTQIKKCVDMQEELNIQIHPEWRFQGYNWDRAIWVECAELMDSLAYKHWKKQEVDLENVKVELIDILHFVLSKGMQIYDNDILINEIYNIAGLLYPRKDDLEFVRQAVESIVNVSTSRVTPNPIKFQTQLQYLIQIWDILFSGENIFINYITKNVLNNFRQNNGYKDGSYIKMWNGREDNVVAFELAKEYEYIDVDFDKWLYNQLEKEYEKVNK